jgi:hypothetical protein
MDEAAVHAGGFFDFDRAVKALLQQRHERHVAFQGNIIVDAGKEGHDVEQALLPLRVRGVGRRRGCQGRLESAHVRFQAR